MGMCCVSRLAKYCPVPDWYAIEANGSVLMSQGEKVTDRVRCICRERESE